MSFYERLHKTCTECGTSPTALMKMLDLSTSKPTNWKKGAIIAHDDLIKIADYLGVTTDYLLDRDYVVSSYQIFVEICAKESKTIFEVAKQFGLTPEQLIQWKQGVEPDKQTLWAIANTYQYFGKNPFDKAKEKGAPLIELDADAKVFSDEELKKIMESRNGLDFIEQIYSQLELRQKVFVLTYLVKFAMTVKIPLTIK